MAQGVVGINGTPTQRQTLAAGIIDLDGLLSTTTIAYQWQISRDNGTTWSDIAGATSSFLALRQSHIGALVRARATYTDAQGNTEDISSAATTAIANVNDVGVATINGATVQGQTLTAGLNEVDGLPTGTVTYRWQQLIGSNWSNISGATASTYTLQAAQVGRQVRVQISYTDPLGGTETNRASAATPAVVSTNPAGNDLGIASINGTATQNEVLAAGVTDRDGIAAGSSISYRWQQGSGATWSDIAGATSRSLVLEQTQVGLQVRAIATYTDTAGNSEEATSAASNVVANVNDVGIVTVFGAPVRGQTLTARVTDVDGLDNVTLNIRWQQSANGTAWSQFATGPTVTLQTAQVGRQIRAIVSYTDQRGTNETNRTSAPTPVVVNANNNPGTLSITGSPSQLQTLSASVSDADGVPAVIAYQWQQSANGTTWSNIAGATASTLSLTQGQVGNLIRATATYTDSLGNAENPVGSATAAVANVNDLGAVAISGIAAQSQTLTATIADPDGVPALASISFQWQSSSDGATWSNVATGPSLTLDASLVGKQLRVSASYADLLGGNESVVSAATAPVAPISASPVTVFTNQTPAQPNFTDGPTVDYELGMRFTSATPGQIQAIRYYKSPSETGSHTGRIWSSTGQLLASVTFTNETASGWQQQTLSTPLAITAGNTHVVSVNNNNYFAVTWNGFATSFVNGPLTAPVGAGIYTDNPGSFPSLVAANANYFRDVVFLPAIANPENRPGTLSITGSPSQLQTLSASVSDADGVPAVIAYQWQQSANGTTWSNIAGATASTLSLTQGQVGNLIRATATYTDSLGNAENPVGSATAAVANVNDLGAVAISGIAAQSQTLTATIADPDGVPALASISFQWQSSSDGATWSNVATGPSLTLDASLVGKQLRVSASYADLLGGNESVVSAATAPVAPISASPVTVFTNQTPAQPNFTDGPTVDYELGMRFTSATPGQIQAIRYYKSPSETGSHTGRIWSSTGQLLASVTFTNETASGWQQQTLSTPLAITAGNTHVVSVNNNNYFAVTWNGFATSFVNGPLTAPVGAGIYTDNPGSFPSLVAANANYFRDVVFLPAIASVALTSNATIYVSEAAGTVTISVSRTSSTGQTTIEYSVNEVGGAASAQAGLDFTQPTFDGRFNTGQVVLENGELSKTFTIPIVNDQLLEGNETFSVGLQNPGPGSALGVPRTMLVTVIDNDSAPVISVSEPTLTISEGAANATITIQRSGNLDAPATVQFATSNGTATAGSDYQATTGTATFNVGQAVQTLSIPLVNDSFTENSETFTVTLANPTGATLGSQTTAAVTMLDDDLALGNLVRQTVVTGLNQPTAIEWTPDGRYMLVAQKDGVVRLVDNGTLRAAPVIDISSTVNFVDGDRGLLGLAIHPDFATTPYIYLLHTYDPPETAGRTGLAGPDGGGNRPSRLVRLTVDPVTMVADPASLTVLVGKNSTWAYTSRPDVDSTGNVNIAPSGIVNGTTITAPADQIDVGTQDNNPNQAGIQNQNIRDYLATDSQSHTIGAVHFGPDGYLYLTNGDGTSYNFVDPRAVRVQDIDNLSGKLLRVDPITGAGVPGNPYYEPNDPNSNQSKVFYSGLRNAYRFTFDPVTGLPVLGDVGWTTWEEINTGPPGANFGWPYLEGPGQTGGYNALSQAIAFYNNGNRNNPGDAPAVQPLVSHSHGAPDFATAITAGDFFTDNLMFFDDVVNGTLYAATFDANRQISSIQVVDTNVPYIVDLQKGPDNWIYGADLGSGTIRRWADPAVTGSGSLAAP